MQRDYLIDNFFILSEKINFPMQIQIQYNLYIILFFIFEYIYNDNNDNYEIILITGLKQMEIYGTS